MKRAVVLLLVALAATAEPVERYGADVNDSLDAMWAEVLRIREEFDRTEGDTKALLDAQIAMLGLYKRATRVSADNIRARAPRVMVDVVHMLSTHYALKLAALDYAAVGETERADACIATTDKIEEVLLPLCDELLWCYKHRW